MSKLKRRQQNKDLDAAIFLNDAAAVKRLLDNGADVNANIGEHNETALILAAQFADAQIVRLLLERGAQLEARDNYDRTALFCAPVPSEIFDILLDKGANLHVRDEDGTTKLMKIIPFASPLESVKELINRGIDVNARDDGGETALSLAKASGFVAVAQLLESVGATD
jgi:ankyrin repeat protein